MVPSPLLPDRLSSTLAALADPTRRAILARLARGETSVTELAQPFEMSLPAVSKHLKVLERAGLVARGRNAQWRPCRLEGRPLREVVDWLERYRSFWDESFARLDGYLLELQKQKIALTTPSPREIVITRFFDAPRRLVFEAWTKPEHVVRWFGPRGFTLPACEIDLRPGGAYRFVNRAPGGKDYPFTGVYREIVPPERLVYTQVLDMEPWSSHEALVALTFAEKDGRTTIASTALYQSVEARDAHLKSGMEKRAAETLDRLADLLLTLITEDKHS